jgi:hypothetical protein
LSCPGPGVEPTDDAWDSFRKTLENLRDTLLGQAITHRISQTNWRPDVLHLSLCVPHCLLSEHASGRSEVLTVSGREPESMQNDLRIPKSWDTVMRRELVELYFDGMDIELLGWHFKMRPLETYRELIGLLFEVAELGGEPFCSSVS